MNSRFELIKIHFPKELGNLEEKLTEFLFPYVGLKDFLALAFLEELLNQSYNTVCPIHFGAKCPYHDGICENCDMICHFPLDIRLKFNSLKSDLKLELEALYEKVKVKINFKKFFP